MAATYAELSSEVASYMRRSSTSFTEGGVNLLLRAINSARKWAERSHDFELSRVSAQVANVSITSGGSLADAKLVGTSTAVSVKKIERAFLTVTGSSAQRPIELQSRATHLRRLRARYEDTLSLQEADVHPLPPAPTIYLSQQGLQIYIHPADQTVLGGTTFTVYLDIVKWLADYTGSGTESDFLIEHCPDFMLLRAVNQLNFFLKEDQRVAISAAALEDAWRSVLAWDASLVAGATDDATTLD